MSRNDEFCIENEEFCIENEEFCMKNDEFCSLYEEIQRILGPADPARFSADAATFQEISSGGRYASIRVAVMAKHLYIHAGRLIDLFVIAAAGHWSH